MVYKINGGHYISAMDIDFANNRLYWSDGIAKEIQSGLILHGKENIEADNILRPLNDYTANVSGIAVDTAAQLIYYAERYVNTINVMKTDGKFHKVLLQFHDNIEFLALSTKFGIIAWSQEKVFSWIKLNTGIHIANCDGTDDKLVAKVSNTVIALAIDETGDIATIYWIHNLAIEFITIGSEMKTIREGLDIYYPLGLVIDPHRLYWSSTNFENTKEANIYVAPLNTPNIAHKLIVKEQAANYNNLKISYKATSQLEKSSEKCSKCQQLCLSSSKVVGKRVCGCGDGFILNATDNVTCVTRKPINDFLVVVDGQLKKIFIVNLNDPKFFEALPINTSERPVAIRYDPLAKNFIWSDIGNHNFQYASAIKFVDFNDNNGEKKEQYIRYNDQKDLLIPKILRDQRNKESLTDGIALEPIRRLLYYTDSQNGAIGVYDLEGVYHKYLISNGLSRPRSIVINRIKGYIFWSEWGKIPKIERATMAGTERKVIVTEYIYWPNGLVSDEKENKLFWIDAKLDALFTCDYNGDKVEMILYVQNHPFGLAVTSTNFYWSDWMTNTIRSVSRDYLGLQDLTDPSFARLLDIDAYENSDWVNKLQELENLKSFDLHDALSDGCFEGFNNSTQTKAKSLWMNNGGCSQFCFPLPGKKRVCGCRDGEILGDNGMTCMIEGKPSPRNYMRRDISIYLGKSVKESHEYVPESHLYESALCSIHDLNTPPNSVQLFQNALPQNVNKDKKKLEVYYKCDAGFIKTGGDEMRICYLNSNLSSIYWTGSDLKCEALKCDNLSTPMNAEKIVCNNNTYDSHCYMKCKKGSDYVSGDEVRTCQLNGKWSGSPILCQGCEYPIMEDNLNITMVSCPKEPAPGNLCKYKCLPGYERVSGSNDILCDPMTLQWNDTILKCEGNEDKICLIPDVTSHHITSGNCSQNIKVSPGQVCTFDCHMSGVDYILYEPLNGTGKITCQDNGKWSEPPLMCKETLICSDLNKDKSEFIDVACPDNKLDSECKLKCKNGKNYLSGPFTRKCVVNNSNEADRKPFWNGDPLVCSKCPPLSWFNDHPSLKIKCGDDSNCNISCESKHWMNVIPARPEIMSMTCSKKSTKNENFIWKELNGKKEIITDEKLLLNNNIPFCGPNLLKFLKSKLSLKFYLRNISSLNNINHNKLQISKNYFRGSRFSKSGCSMF
ncbi:low-density lipoprotein receptor-related protein 4-like [Gordionus sp. m RMFG-2023]|uniref:low-density lipoprotein receptor-related protein 4-like n=1 Tax=Gordionus sp. m RMFG-2023 TaxID=3053472 RepID=UPI0031FC260A